MIRDWIKISKARISGAEQLYPDGLDWDLRPGVNVVVGGTGLGKTTLVYALQYAIFEKMVVAPDERIEREFFAHRLTARSDEKLKTNPPFVEVHFEAGGAPFIVRRNLISGALIEATCDGTHIKSSQYPRVLSEKVGAEGDFASMARLQSHLLFFGESRYLLAWDNLAQNELMSLLLADHSQYQLQSKLWEEAESADSEARNLSAQAARLKRDVEEFAGNSNVTELERRDRLKEVEEKRKECEAQLRNIRQELLEETKRFARQEQSVATVQKEFHQNLERFEEENSADLDEDLLAVAMTDTPTVSSVRYALTQFFSHPNERTCPCCGRLGISQVAQKHATIVVSDAAKGGCIVCDKPNAIPKASLQGRPLPTTEPTDASVSKYQKAVLEREQTQSRLASLKQEEAKAVDALAAARAEESTFLREHPVATSDPLRVAIDQLTSRQRAAMRRRDRTVAQLKEQLKRTNAAFEKIQEKIAKAFKKYATLYLDEPCKVEFLTESELPRKRGPQIKAPHAAFFPVISGRTRPSAQALSDAQRSFIDLAFRMAVVDVWHQETGKTVTLFVETPEGAVDIAYMERVATMLRTFGAQGHVMIITTNLNNDIFLPELLSGHRKAERLPRILNLIERGRPRQVQKDHWRDFSSILGKVESRRVVA